MSLSAEDAEVARDAVSSDHSVLQRITTEYRAQEDRLCLTGERADGDAVVLWLTQRLLNRLVPHLTAWLEQQKGPGEHARVMLEFQQQAAVDALKPQPPVRPPTDAPGRLVRSADIAAGAEAVQLGFKEQDAGPVLASLVLAPNALRQWLAIVHAQYLRGDWPTTVWPAWLAAGTPAPAAGPSAAVLH